MRSFVLLALPCLLSGQDFTFRRLPATGSTPAARVDGVISYDALQRRILLFGGRDTSPRNDLWSYSIDRGEWMELRPAGPLPPARFGHTVLFDEERRRLILFGGQAGGFFSDTWSYDIDNNRWSQLAADNAGPSRRYGHSAVLDAARGRMIISHGFTNSGRFDDTWAFDLRTNRWQEISPSQGRPLRRCLHHAVLDSAGNQMLLYGGCASGFGPCPLGDLWSFDLTTHRWTERTAATRPSPRQWHGLGFDAARRRLILFGGSGDAGALSDAWDYDPASNQWTQIHPFDPPSARDRHETVFVPDLGIVFFGGQSNFVASSELLLLGPRLGAPRFTSSGVLNEFTAQAGPIAPGQLVSIVGTALGPETVVVNSLTEAGTLPRSAAGVAVTFNGIQAPVLSAQASRLVVQAPYEIAGLSATDIVISSGGQTSEAVRVAVAPVSPGIHPSIVRLDGSAVSVENPAAPGDVIVLLATGLGEIVPSIATGAAPRGEEQYAPAAPVRVSIGEHVAELLMIAPARERVGVFQLSLRVPEQAAGAVPLTLTAGDASTTASIYIEGQQQPRVDP